MLKGGCSLSSKERKKERKRSALLLLKSSLYSKASIIRHLSKPDERTKMSTDAQKAAKVPSSSLSSSSSGGRSAPAHVLFASLHALSAWLSVKSLAFVKALDQHETDDFGDDIIVTNNGPRSAVALLHRSACAIHLLRSAMRTYRELRNDDERQKQRRRRRRISSSKKKRKSTVKVLDWVFLRNTQTNAHDAKSTLERGERNCISRNKSRRPERSII